MIRQYLRRRPTVRRDIAAVKEYTNGVIFKVLLWAVAIGFPLYLGGHVALAHYKNLI